MFSSNKKRLAAIALGLIILLIFWGRKRLSNPPSEPAAVPVAEQPSAPVTEEARPAPPLEPVKKPQARPVKPVQIQRKKVAAAPILQTPKPAVAPVRPAAVPVVPVAAPPVSEPLEWMGNDTAITHAGEVVIRNDHQWISFWAEHHPHEVAPDVDFSRSMVVGVFAGARPAEQFMIRIENIRTLPDSVTIDYREKLPPPGTFAVDVTVYPYHLKVIPLTPLKVKFNKLALIDPNR